ncbi:MAG: M48 family metalloprotease [Pyrinomonadaceae bacterium]
MLKQIFSLTGLLFAATTTTAAVAASANVVELAARALGAGPAAEIKERIFKRPFTMHDAAYRREAFAALPAAIRDSRITEGKIARRTERVVRTVLELHSRRDAIELVLFHDDRPLGMLFRESVLVLSRGLVAALEDSELAGIVAHELGHTYFIGELALAHGAQDLRGMKVVELKCDAVAMLTLQLLGNDPGDLISGLRKLERVRERMLLSSHRNESHPNIVARAQFAERFSKLLIARKG